MLKNLFHHRFNQFISFVFLICVGLIVFLTHTTIQNKTEAYKKEKRASIGSKIDSEISTLIFEKKDATLAMAISLSSNDIFKEALKNKTPSIINLGDITKEYKKNTVFQNVWIQVIDKEGRSFSRSWTDKVLSLIHI